ncbi:MAG: extracellular solute-binding protein [Clostridia bacterium]|nr:extracellular solute-binding protein [Clostridia bacterium]
MKKVLMMLLCGMMLLSVLAGCANGEQSGETTTAATEEENYWISPALSVTDEFSGKTLTLLVNHEMNAGSDEASSDPLEDAIYRRNDKLESTYGIEINTLLDTDYVSLGGKVTKDVSSGNGEYDLVYQHMVNSATSLATNGLLIDLGDLEYVDFDQVWWDQDAREGFTIGNHQFLAVGDLLPHTLLYSACLAFNKNHFDDQGLEYPYDLAREGVWTLDELNALTKDQTKDINGDGKIEYENDYFGMTSWHLAGPFNFFFGSGATFFTKDSDNYPVFSVDQDKIQNIYDKVYTTFMDNNSLYITDVGIHTEAYKVFTRGNALFCSCSLTQIAMTEHGFKDMADEYGLVPQPKYDTNQKDYMSFVNGAAAVVVVPKSVAADKLGFVGFAMEALSSSSYYMVTDTLYDKVAKAKNVRDQESAEMVDIIIRNRVFDFGYAHFYSKGYPCAVLFQTCLDGKNTSIASAIKRTSEKTMTKDINKILEVYQGD